MIFLISRTAQQQSGAARLSTVASKLGMVYRTLVVALLSSSATSATVLTPDNYDSLTSGQSVFIKFYAPWSVLQ